MKKILNYLLLAITLTFAACSNSDDPIQGTSLPVTYANIAGIWRLEQWNGTPTNQERYCYLVIERRADDETGLRALKMYTNIDSDKAHLVTSTYELTEDEKLGATIISGLYDYGAGFWTNSYIVNLTNDQMTWTVTDDADDVSVYVRCNEVPEDIQNGTRAL